MSGRVNDFFSNATDSSKIICEKKETIPIQTWLGTRTNK
jgi:hypothetical protein